MSPLLNKYEMVTYEHLKPVCEKNGAIVFAKVRLKDVLPVENSGITSEDFRFSLQAHFDFVVTDHTTKPLFAVEYDGAGHAASKQAKRDDRKNALCERFDLSLLRINSRYMDQKFRGLDLLTYFVDVWFMRDAFEEAQRSGHISYEDDFDPWLVASDGRSEKKFPFWLSADAQISLQRLHKLGQISEPIPSDFVGEDQTGSYRCLSWIAIAPGQYATVTTGIRSQHFPVVLSDLISQVATCELFDRVKAILRGKAAPTPEGILMSRISDHENRYSMRACSGFAHYRKQRP